MIKNKTKNLKITQVPFLDRPYEKLEKNGVESLSDSELLAIIIKTGTKEKNCVEIAKEIMSKKENELEGFEYLYSCSLSELNMFNGIGRVKAIQIKAVLEIAKRIKYKTKDIKKIISPRNIYDLLKLELEDAKVEIMKVVSLNNKNIIKSINTISIGGVTKVGAGMKEILSEPIKQMAAAIVIVHNHPSGDSTPSKADINLTMKINDYANIFDIKLIDHIIIGKNSYTSIKEINPELLERRKLL